MLKYTGYIRKIRYYSESSNYIFALLINLQSIKNTKNFKHNTIMKSNDLILKITYTKIIVCQYLHSLL